MTKTIRSNGSGYSVFACEGESTRVLFTVIPSSRGSIQEQVQECLESIRTDLPKMAVPTVIGFQTVFLRNLEDRAICERLFSSHYGMHRPVTTYINQTPCCGADIIIEAWGLGGKSLNIHRSSPNLISVTDHDVSWIHCGGITPQIKAEGVYDQSNDCFSQMRDHLSKWGVNYDRVFRTWLYLGDIVGPEGETQRYKELNRARTDFYQGMQFVKPYVPADLAARVPVYPASTGIGAHGKVLTTSCTAILSRRKDVHLIPLENPAQTPAQEYERKYGMQSPKFARAMGVIVGDNVTTFVSGTASIINSQTVHIGDPGKQADTTIDNIEKLISKANYAGHGMPGAGGDLSTMANVRVYVKKQEYYESIKAVCERRLPNTPLIYTIADVCRDDLLVELEGVAFSKRERD